MFHNIGQVCPLTCWVLRSCWLGTDLPPLRVSLTSNLDPQVGTFGSRSWPHGMCRQGSSRTPRPQDSLPAEMWMCPFSGSMNHVHSLILVSLNLCKGFSPTFFPQLFRVGDVIAEALLTTLKKKKKSCLTFFFSWSGYSQPSPLHMCLAVNKTSLQPRKGERLCVWEPGEEAECLLAVEASLARDLLLPGLSGAERAHRSDI